jgi:hypothetical protein
MADFPRFTPGQSFGVRGPGGRIVLDEAAAALLNEAAVELQRLGHVTVRPPLTWAEEPSRRLAIDLPPSMYALLSGGGDPYDFVEQIYDSGTGWSNRTGGRTGECYEYNALPDLAGEVVPIHYEPVTNEWRFQYQHNQQLADCTHVPTTLYLKSDPHTRPFGSTTPGKVMMSYDAGSGLWTCAVKAWANNAGNPSGGIFNVVSGTCTGTGNFTYFVFQMNAAFHLTMQSEACSTNPSTLVPVTQPENSPPGSNIGSLLFGPASTTIGVRGTNTRATILSCSGSPLRITGSFGGGSIEITATP